MITPDELAELDFQLHLEAQRLEIAEAVTEKQRAERLREYERLLAEPRCNVGENNAHPNGRWS